MDEEAFGGSLDKFVFTGVFKLQLLLWVTRRKDPVFYQGQMGEETGINNSQMGSYLKEMQKLDLVEAIPRNPGEKTHRWRRLESPLWDWLSHYLNVRLDTIDFPKRHEYLRQLVLYLAENGGREKRIDVLLWALRSGLRAATAYSIMKEGEKQGLLIEVGGSTQATVVLTAQGWRAVSEGE